MPMPELDIPLTFLRVLPLDPSEMTMPLALPKREVPARLARVLKLEFDCRLIPWLVPEVAVMPERLLPELP